MACNCRQNRSNFSATANVDSMTATINLPSSLASNGTTPLSSTSLTSTACWKQRFISRCCPVRQLLTLSGILSGLPSAENIPVSYTIQGMPGTATTDGAGRYTVEAYPGENVVITAPILAGYTAMPAQYLFSPACFSSLDLNFEYAAAVSEISSLMVGRQRPSPSISLKA